MKLKNLVITSLILSSVLFTTGCRGRDSDYHNGIIPLWYLPFLAHKNSPSFDPNVPVTNVPGPLPILGAGMAFAWSRRLRNRIRQF